MKVKIKVTKDILERSKMCGTAQFKGLITKSCAIALAIREILPHSAVILDQIHYNFCKYIDLPLIATEFILKFDNLTKFPEERTKLDPIEFEIDIPEDWFEDVNLDEIKEIIEKSETLELV